MPDIENTNTKYEKLPDHIWELVLPHLQAREKLYAEAQRESEYAAKILSAYSDRFREGELELNVEQRALVAPQANEEG
jgi:hypothetical protein